MSRGRELRPTPVRGGCMTTPKRLVRKPASGRLGGVCAGIADYLDTDVTLVRLLWVILSIVPGGFIGGGLWELAAGGVMSPSGAPRGRGARAPRARRTRGRPARVRRGVRG